MELLHKLDNYKNYGLLFIRIALGIMFMYHGFPKLMGGTASWAQIGGAMSLLGISFLPAFWGFMAAAVEFFGGILFVAGFQFRIVCALQAINMVVATVFHFSNGDGLGGAAHAIEDCIIFIGLIFVGAGIYSVDNKLKPAVI